MERMLVTQALNELKLLDERIEKKTKNAKFVCAAKTSEKNAEAGVTKEEYKERALATYDSIVDLINRRASIKAAVDKSNVATMVTVAGEKCSVTEAIYKKNNTITYLNNLVSRLKKQFGDATFQIHLKEQEFDRQVSSVISLSGEKNAKKDDYDAIAASMKNLFEYSIVTPFDIKKEIEELETYIEDFTSEVDYVLQASNCTTYIEF